MTIQALVGLFLFTNYSCKFCVGMTQVGIDALSSNSSGSKDLTVEARVILLEQRLAQEHAGTNDLPGMPNVCCPPDSSVIASSYKCPL